MQYNRFYARVDLGAIGRNIEKVRRSIPDGTMIMAVIKADAYGHGALAVAEYLEDKADQFGVACVDEALELRGAGCKKPILILGNANPSEYSAIAENDITATVFTLEDARLLSKEASRLGKVATVHIKVDTGMSRIGGKPNEAFAEEVKEISQLPNINIGGIFTHFACADEADKTEAVNQRELFDGFVEMLERRGVEIPVKHVDNSAGIMELDRHYNMVRMGIMLYGLYPSEETDRSWKLYPAMELIGKVSYVKTVPAGAGISYGHTFVADREMRVATVSVGYADGYPRSLSNKGCVLIGGVRCPVIGRVCMDQMMVDISRAGDVKRGDDAVIVGHCGEEYISADEVSEAAGSFNYEFVCGISRRVPRVYFDGERCLGEVSYIKKTL